MARDLVLIVRGQPVYVATRTHRISFLAVSCDPRDPDSVEQPHELSSAQIIACLLFPAGG